MVAAREITANVKTALAEDIGSGDITAALLPATMNVSAALITHEHAVLCGCDWFTEAFHQLDRAIDIEWYAADKDSIYPNQVVCEINGPIRPILTGERTAINFLQTLSGTATTVADFVDLIGAAPARILDTRKTIPGLRRAQKYAVTCGGGVNHRLGLFDAVLIKENHGAAAGGIAKAIALAKQKQVPVIVEVESLEELKQALELNPEQILLDNFTVAELVEAVSITRGQARLEASGNVDRQNIRAIADTGVDFISIGALTKHVHAVDFSLCVAV